MSNGLKQPAESQAKVESGLVKSSGKAFLMFTVVIVLVIVFVLALFLKGGESPTLVGRWNIESYSELGTPFTAASGYIEFRANGTGTLNVTFPNGGRTTPNFEWSCYADRVVIGGVTGGYSIDDDVLTMSCNFWELTGTKSQENQH